MAKKLGRCAQVWKTLDGLYQQNRIPTVDDILRVGRRRRWNPNNTRTEYYAWRRSHGIFGRMNQSQISA